MSELFHRIATRISIFAGSPLTFVAALSVIALWALSGPTFGYSDTWQLIINTSTTIITFLMVFLIQNTQNRDNKAIHLKLDELLKSVKGARTGLVSIEDMPDAQLESLRQEFVKLHEHYSSELVEHKGRLAVTTDSKVDIVK